MIAVQSTLVKLYANHIWLSQIISEPQQSAFFRDRSKESPPYETPSTTHNHQQQPENLWNRTRRRGFLIAGLSKEEETVYIPLDNIIRSIESSRSEKSKIVLQAEGLASSPRSQHQHPTRFAHRLACFPI